MRLIDFIADLQNLYNSYSDEYKSTVGEPEIVIDIFSQSKKDAMEYKYSGYSDKIKIEKSEDGIFDVLSAFSSTYKNVIKIS